jgi:hypothetical protein
VKFMNPSHAHNSGRCAIQSRLTTAEPSRLVVARLRPTAVLPLLVVAPHGGACHMVATPHDRMGGVTEAARRRSGGARRTWPAAATTAAEAT